MRRRPKAVALRSNPFLLAMFSAKGALKGLADFMYGTPERVKLTCAFAFALGVAGAILKATSAAPIVCPV